MVVNDKYHIALFQKHLKILYDNSDGIGRVQWNLSKAFINNGHKVDLIICDQNNSNLWKLPKETNLIQLSPSTKLKSSFYTFLADPGHLWFKPKTVFFSSLRPRSLRYLPGYVNYLQNNQPDIVISAHTAFNLVALLASNIIKNQQPTIITEHSIWAENPKDKKSHDKWKWWFPPSELANLYSKALKIVAVSNGVAENVSSVMNLERKKIITIYNPIVSSDLFFQANQEIKHQWIKEKGCPVILGVGRLVHQKNFSLLIKAFARVQRNRLSRLIILGDGKERDDLQRLVREYNLCDSVDLLGFVDNPYAYMTKADLLVLSSNTEGLPTVLIEALACGCPVVSTNCSGGPAEILEDGLYGPLVPVNDEEALAEAIISVLDSPPDPNWLKKRGMDFSVDKAAANYLQAAID